MFVSENEVERAPSANEQYANAVSVGRESYAVLAAAFTHEEFGRRLVRLKYANEADEYQWCLNRLKDEAVGRNLRKWNADMAGARRLAKQVLDYWIADTCPACIGRGATQIPETPHLRAICPDCDNGVRRWQLGGEWQNRGGELLSLLNQRVGVFGGAVNRWVRGEQ